MRYFFYKLFSFFSSWIIIIPIFIFIIYLSFRDYGIPELTNDRDLLISQNLTLNSSISRLKERSRDSEIEDLRIRFNALEPYFLKVENLYEDLELLTYSMISGTSFDINNLSDKEALFSDSIYDLGLIRMDLQLSLDAVPEAGMDRALVFPSIELLSQIKNFEDTIPLKDLIGLDIQRRDSVYLIKQAWLFPYINSGHNFDDSINKNN